MSETEHSGGDAAPEGAQQRGDRSSNSRRGPRNNNRNPRTRNDTSSNEHNTNDDGTSAAKSEANFGRDGRRGGRDGDRQQRSNGRRNNSGNRGGNRNNTESDSKSERNQGRSRTHKDTRAPKDVPEIDLTKKKFDDSDCKDDLSKNEVCYICTEHMRYRAVGVCNHSVCHSCNLRLRALYKNNACTFCKVDQEFVIYTKSMDTPFEEFDTNEMGEKDKLGIYFDCDEVRERALAMVMFNCPVVDCDTVCNQGWKALKSHVQTKHGRYLCDLCIKNKKIFVHEQALYTSEELARHNKTGDKSDPSFKGHPFCIFCKKHYYDDEALFEHCRTSHEKCYLCNDQFQYYKDFEELEKHLSKAHYRCENATCLDDRFAYFKSVAELMEHCDRIHGGQCIIKGKNVSTRSRNDGLGFFYEKPGSGSGERDSGRSISNRSNGTSARERRPNGTFSDEALKKLPRELKASIEYMLGYSKSAINDFDMALQDYMESVSDADAFIKQYTAISLSHRNDIEQGPIEIESEKKNTAAEKYTTDRKIREIQAGKIWRELAVVIPENNLRSKPKNNSKNNGAQTLDLYNVTYQDMLRAWSDWKDEESTTFDYTKNPRPGSTTSAGAIRDASSPLDAKSKPMWVAANNQRMTGGSSSADYFPSLPTTSTPSKNALKAGRYNSAAAVASRAASKPQYTGVGGRTVIGANSARHTSSSAGTYTNPSAKSITFQMAPSSSASSWGGKPSNDDFPSVGSWQKVSGGSGGKGSKSDSSSMSGLSSNGFASLEGISITPLVNNSSNGSNTSSVRGKNKNSVQDFPGLPSYSIPAERHRKNKAEAQPMERNISSSSDLVNAGGYVSISKDDGNDDTQQNGAASSKSGKKKQKQKKQFIQLY